MEQSRIKKIFSNPYMNLVSMLLGIFGIILAIYIYSQSKETRKLTYSISPSKALVVDSIKASKLQVLYDSTIISSDIVAIQMAIWNQGKLSIKPENILNNILIKTSKPVKILETSIRKASRGVTNIKIDKNNFNNGMIGLNWDILENNDGAVIQILYAGTLETNFFVEGIIEGQSDIKQIKNIDSKDLPRPFTPILMGIGILLFSWFHSYMVKHPGTRTTYSNKYLKELSALVENKALNSILAFVLILMGSVTFVLGIIILIFYPPSVPFTF